MNNQTTNIIKANLKKRYAAEKRFRIYGLLSIILSLSFLALLMVNIFSKGLPAFSQTYIKLDIDLNSEVLEIDSKASQAELRQADYNLLVKNALKVLFPEVTERKQKRILKKLVSSNAQFRLQNMVLENPNLIGSKQSVWFLADDDIDMYFKGHIDRSLAEEKRRVKDIQITWLDTLVSQNRIEKQFNVEFFTNGDSREPEQAGILSALMGSFYTMIVTLLLTFPIGVAAAIYLEEFAPKDNIFVDFIEVNINNLAAVPSIIFGLLGLAIFIQIFGVPRSTPLIGGLVLTLMTLPTIIIASRAALKAVPPSIREAAFGMGASRVQTVFHHTLPLAMPGILTGTIIGMAQALGETAPLLMIGMIAFIIDIPASIGDPAAALPVQVFLWSDSPERAFTEKTSAAIIILLGFLILMNLLAVLLRKKFEKRW